MGGGWIEDKCTKSTGGSVQEVDKGVVTARVRIKIENPVVITAIISKEAIEELDIKSGDQVEAVIKATEVMVAKEKQP